MSQLDGWMDGALLRTLSPFSYGVLLARKGFVV